jgi:ribosomal protein S18 acetylase RimI-like enzyme
VINLKNYEDLSELKLLMAECMWANDEKIDNELNMYIGNDSRELLGSLINDELVGLIGIIYKSTNEVELKHIAIKPNYRGKGIGSEMVNEFINTENIVKIKAETDIDAVGFYKKIGFSITSLGEKYPGVERFECIFSATKNSSDH